MGMVMTQNTPAGLLLAFQVADVPGAADGEWGTPQDDGWYLVATADTSAPEWAWLIERDARGRPDLPSTAQAYARRQIALTGAVHGGRWRVRGGCRGLSAENPVLAEGTFDA